MPILFLAGLLGALLVSPLLTHRIYGAAYDWESRQIALDNGAIQLGQSDRALLNYLAASNRLLESLEHAHHPIHVCARVPESAPTCIPKDIEIEAYIQEVHARTGMVARAWWKRGREVVARQAKGGLAGLENWRRPDFPFHLVRCPVCGVAIAWEISPFPIATCFRARSSVPIQVAVVLHGASLRRSHPLDYSLRATCPETEGADHG